MDEKEKLKMKNKTKIIGASITAGCSLVTGLVGMIYASSNPNVQNVFNYNNWYGVEEKSNTITTSSNASNTYITLPDTTTQAQSEFMWLDTLGYEQFNAKYPLSTVCSLGKFNKNDDKFDRAVQITTFTPSDKYVKDEEQIELSYNLNSKFSFFDCSLVAQNDEQHFKPSTFFIYCDNYLVYKSPAFTSKSPNIKIEGLNISKCNILTFKIVTPLAVDAWGNDYTRQIYLAEAKLY